MLDHVLREHAVLDLIDGLSDLTGQGFEPHPDQDGAADVVALGARLATLAGLDAGELLLFAVKLLNLPAQAGRFLHGLGGEWR